MQLNKIVDSPLTQLRLLEGCWLQLFRLAQKLAGCTLANSVVTLSPSTILQPPMGGVVQMCTERTASFPPQGRTWTTTRWWPPPPARRTA